jgi:two-component sensor histidine kinase
MTKTKSFWQKQVSGPERAFLLEVLASRFGRSLYIPLGFATIIFSTGFLFPDEVFSGISVHYLDALTFPVSLGVFLLARLISDKRFDGRLNVLLWITSGTLSALAPTTFLLLVTGQAPVKFSSQIPIGIVAYSLLVTGVAVIGSGLALSRSRYKKLKEHKTLLNTIRTELEDQIVIMRGEIKQSVDAELSKALDVLNEGKSSKDLAGKLFAAIDEVIRPLSHRLSGLGLKVKPPKSTNRVTPISPNRKGVSIARLVAPEFYLVAFAIFILPATVYVQGTVGLITASALLLVEVMALWLIRRFATDVYLNRLVAIMVLAALSAVIGSIYPLLLNHETDSGISVGFVTTSIGTTSLMALISKRLDDINKLEIVNQEMQAVVSVLRQEAWVTKNQLAKAIHGSVQAKFLSVALRIANEPKLSKAELAAAKKDIEASIDDVALSLEGRAEPFAKQFKTITDAWDGVVNLKLKADKATIAKINQYPVARTCLLEVIGEAVSNAAKHSQATTMDIELQENSIGQLAVSIWSAGKLADSPSRKGYGSQMLDEVTSGWSLSNLKGRVYLRALIQLSK